MNIAISLGHNSSAALIKDNVVVEAYEEERFTKVKSDSHFPIHCIAKILENNKPDKENTLYVSHWYDDFDFHKKESTIPSISKHYNFQYVKKLVDKYNFKIVSLSETVTHHDAHAWSVYAFAKSNKMSNIDNSIIIVADGFGNKQEVFSVYTTKNDKVEKLISSVDYKKSYGLLYQYATSYCGMKENEDEYKFLGYESLIEDVLSSEDITKVKHQAEKLGEDLMSYHLNEDNNKVFSSSDYINVNYLYETKDYYTEIFNRVLKTVNMQDALTHEKRIIIGFFIQSTIEKSFKLIVQSLQETYKPDAFLLAGGVFYNVKLNNTILNALEHEKLCVIPIAGDQACGIGLYNAYNNVEIPSLILSKRSLQYDNVYYFENDEDFVQTAVQLLLDDKIVNVLQGDMEFGPRALCNTSTLALPTSDNVEFINMLNKRNTVMPMAPVMKRENIGFFFNEDEYSKVVGSDKYMVITYTYKKGVDLEKYGGVMHNIPLTDLYSGRPQVVEPSTNIHKILSELESKTKCLINTSFNIHGTPIVYSVEDALHSFSYQNNMAKELNLPARNYLLIRGKK